MRFICVVTITSASSRGVAPPASPVPLPRATNGRPCLRAMRTAAATSAADLGQQTATAWPSLTPASCAYERELEWLGARTGRTERGAQIGEERVVCDPEPTRSDVSADAANDSVRPDP